MANDTEPKKYGLILGKQKRALASSKSKLSAFADDDDDVADKNDVRKSRRSNVVAQEERVKRHVQSQIEQALTEDPTVFEYDAVFDEMEREKSCKFDKKREKDQKREPKYIKHLLKAAQLRQREYDAREERKQAIEREKEGAEFDDKEIFVTAAYRQKVEELEAYKEEEKRKDYLESVMDVTRQKDISGFYKHLLNDMAESSKDGAASGAKPVKEGLDDKEKFNTSKLNAKSKEALKKKPKIEQDSEEDPVEERPAGKTSTGRVKSPTSNASIESVKNSTPDEREEKKEKLDPVNERKERNSAHSRDIRPEKTLKKIGPEKTIKTESVEIAEKSVEKKSTISEELEKELAIKKRLDALRKLLSRQNDEMKVDEYRCRYFQRKAQKS